MFLFLLCYSAKLWYFIAAAVMFCWCFFEYHWWNSVDLDANNIDLLCFQCASLWKTDVSLLLYWWFIDNFLMKYLWKMETSMQTLLITKNLIVLIFYFLRLHCCLILYSLMSLWTNFDATLMILIQTLIRNILLKVIMFKTLRFH